MKLKKVSYKHIKKEVKSQFYELLKELFPLLRISFIEDKGLVTFRDKGFLFFLKRKNKVSIDTVLFTYLPEALAIRTFGNTQENSIEYFNKRLKQLLLTNSQGDKLENISRVITFFFNECFDKDNNTPYEVQTTYNLPRVDIDDTVSEEEQTFEGGETANFLDWVVLRPIKSKRIKKSVRKFVVAASLASFLGFLEPLKGNISELADNLLLRAPPQLYITLYNST